ncbi:AAA family ATPase [Corynebacterium sp. AOP12-C2-36]|uniref:AAA family ATPase n=1 Tax=Corynebacterium sp. AOP12-C2-36 TaxID=3457723 RepID=UPI00403376C4
MKVRHRGSETTPTPRPGGAHRVENKVTRAVIDETLSVIDALGRGDAERATRAARYLAAPTGHDRDDQCDAHILAIAAGQCAHLSAVRSAGAGDSVPLPPPIDHDTLAAAYRTRATYGSLITLAINTARQARGEEPQAMDTQPVFARWTTFGISWAILTSDDVAGAWALELAVSGDLAEANDVLTDVGMLRRPLLQAARLALYLESQRWGDLIDAVQRTVGDENLADPQLYAIAQACLGMALASLDNHEAAGAAFRVAEESPLPAISAWAHLRHGLYLRTRGDLDSAASHLAASVVTHYTAQAEAAQNDNTRKLRTTTRMLVHTRTDPWDVNTEDDPEITRARQAEEKRGSYREEAESMLSRQIGMVAVKENLHAVADLMVVNQEMERRGLTTNPANYNQRFEGPPGTGKSTIVRAFTRYLASVGIVDDPEPMITGPEDFIDKHIGGTGEKTKAVVAQAKNKVLFIDETYAFLSDPTGSTGSDSAGIQAINTLVGLMEPLIGTTVFVFAGYPEDMQRLMRTNPGLERRLPNTNRFSSFELEQFSAVTQTEAEKTGLVLADDVIEFLADDNGPARRLHERNVTGAKTIMDDLGNGGFARNLVQRANLRRAKRLRGADMSALSQDEIQALTFDDVVPAFNEYVDASMHGTPVSD